MAKHSVLFASDSRLFRAALASGIENDALTVVATVDFTSELIMALTTMDRKPDLVVIDSPLDLEHEIAVLTDINRAFPEIGVLVLADRVDGPHMSRVLRTGARGFLPKSISLSTLRLLLQLTALGENLFTAPLLPTNRAVASKTVASHDQGYLSAPLSERELEILDCLGTGFSNKAIAEELGVAEATVKVHIKSVMRKINVKNRTQAAVWIINNRLLKAVNGKPPLPFVKLVD
jgi:two-component system nitrate/nitrite response regulator NarL